MAFKCSHPYFSSRDNSTIDVTWEHPTLGKILFTASPNDKEQHGSLIYKSALKGDYGPVTSYTDSHWFSIENNNNWNGITYGLGQLMISPTGVQPPNSTNIPIPPKI